MKSVGPSRFACKFRIIYLTARLKPTCSSAPTRLATRLRIQSSYFKSTCWAYDVFLIRVWNMVARTIFNSTRNSNCYYIIIYFINKYFSRKSYTIYCPVHSGDRLPSSTEFCFFFLNSCRLVTTVFWKL